MTNDKSSFRSHQNRFFRAKEFHCYYPLAGTKLSQIFLRNPPITIHSEKKKWENFPDVNLEGISWIGVIYVKRSPLIGGNAQIFSNVIFLTVNSYQDVCFIMCFLSENNVVCHL
jgi:hypothetical protein